MGKKKDERQYEAAAAATSAYLQGYADGAEALLIAAEDGYLRAVGQVLR